MTDEDNYMDDYISMQGIYGSAPGDRHVETREKPRRSLKFDGDELDTGRGIIDAKTVFYVVAFTAIATTVVNPALLIYTLPLSVFSSTMLALARRTTRRRQPRRIGVEE